MAGPRFRPSSAGLERQSVIEIVSGIERRKVTSPSECWTSAHDLVLAGENRVADLDSMTWTAPGGVEPRSLTRWHLMDVAVETYLNAISSPVRRRDADTMIELMRRATGQEPRVWPGSIVGFGEYHYRYDSGREGHASAAGFAARKAATTIYLVDGIGAHADLLDELGPHSTGVGCVYVKDLSKVNLDVLETIVARSYTALTAATYTKRAREGGTS